MKEKEGKLVPLFKIAFICLVFSLVELLSGIEAHSLSVVSDAAHVFSDLISVLIAILSLYLQDKASSPDLPFGYSGVETIGAIANLVLVWRLTYYLLTEAVEKINTRDRVEHPLLMLLISVVGLAANYFMAQLLHSSEAAALLGHSCHSHDCHTDQSPAQSTHLHSHEGGECHQGNQSLSHSHSHSCHGHDHQHDQDNQHDHQHDHQHQHHSHQGQKSQALQHSANRIKSLSLEGLRIHILADIFQSVAVLVSSSLIYCFAPDSEDYHPVYLADSICTLIFCFLSLSFSLPLFRKVCDRVLFKAPPHCHETLLAAIRRVGGLDPELKLMKVSESKMLACVRVQGSGGHGLYRAIQRECRQVGATQSFIVIRQDRCQ